MEWSNKWRKESLSHLINSTNFLVPLAWAPTEDTCPWLYGQASLPHQLFRGGLPTAHTQVLCFYGSLEDPSDFSSVSTALLSWRKRASWSSWSPPCWCFLPCPTEGKQGTWETWCSSLRDGAQSVDFLSITISLNLSFWSYSLCYRYCKSRQVLHSELMTKLQKAILNTTKELWNLHYLWVLRKLLSLFCLFSCSVFFWVCFKFCCFSAYLPPPYKIL